MLKIAMALFGPLLLLGLLEGTAFVWEKKQAQGPYAWELVASRRIDLIEFHSPVAGYALMKPGKHYEWQNIPVDINSHGLRSPEVPYEKPPGTFRVLNLGDSVVMGWGVRAGDTYGRKLETLLNERSGGNPKYEVINAGVPGWNQENEFAYLQAEGLKYRPDLVLLDLTIVNDIYGASALLAHPQSAPIKWLRDNTYFWPFLTVEARWIEARVKGKDRIGVLDPPKNPASYFPIKSTDKKWDQMWSLISDIRKTTADQGSKFALVLFPLEHQVVDTSYPRLPQEVFCQRAAAAHISCVDLLPAFQAACDRKPGGRCQLEDHYLFADLWMHPSAIGHQITTEEIIKQVGDEFIPADVSR